MPEPRDLILIGNARRDLAEAKSLDDVKKVRDKAEAIRMYARAQGDCEKIQNQAAEVKLRAERRAGELLSGMEKQTGGHAAKARSGKVTEVEAPPKLSDIGITKNQSSQWQQVAAVPEPVFEQHVAEHIEEHKPLTTSGVLALTKPSNGNGDIQPTRHKPTGGEVWCKWIGECIRVLNDTRDAGGIEGLVASWAPGEREHYAEMLGKLRDACDRWVSYLEKSCKTKKAG